MKNKAEIRQEWLYWRDGLSLLERQRRSLQIRQTLLGLEKIRKARRVMLFASMGSEVDTWGLAADLLQQDKQLFFPKTYWQERAIKAFAVQNLTADLRLGRFGVQEPSSDAVMCSPAELDVILLPGLAFSKNGCRIGYGAGLYDRFLASSSSYHVAVSFFEQLLSQIPCEAHDVRYDVLVTDQGLYTPNT